MPTRIVLLRNIADTGELVGENEYYDLKEDIREECAKLGTLKSMEMPRPSDYQDKNPILGRAFLEYATIEEAKEARRVIFHSFYF